MLKKILSLLIFPFVYSNENIPLGNQIDEHNCFLDGGYTWCDSTQKCSRPWIEPCPTLVSNTYETLFCTYSNIQKCNRLCDTPICENNQCAMRINNCCDYMCEPRCKTIRDTYGNCISHGCSNWFNGCNVCSVVDNTIQSCRQDNICYERKPGYCIDDTSNSMNVPWNCVTWFDGCNTCYHINGALGGCTMMMCFTRAEPYCMTYTTEPLRLGDICYRFCEDGSQTSISRRNDCPKNTVCTQDNPNKIAFDTCSNNALRCIPSNAH